MFCTYCSEENPDSAVFCTNCGRRLEKELQTPPAGIAPVPGERMSGGQAPAEQVAAMRESSPAGRDIAPHATFLTSPASLPPASIPSSGGPSPVAVLDRVSLPSQQSLKEQTNIPTSSGEALPAAPAPPTWVSSYSEATLPIQTSVKSPPTSVGSPPTSSPPKKGLRDKLPKKWRIMALIALIILLVGGSASFLIPWLHATLPAATATVTMTPANQRLTQTYAIDAVTGTPDTSQHQVQARALSFTTQAQSKTVIATGKGHQEATAAQGKVTVSPRTGTVPAGILHIPSDSGANIIIQVTSPVSSGSQTFDAWAEKAGPGGNIAAYNIDGLYQMVDEPGITYYLQNTQAFTGGQDAHDYTFVQQSDIDGAATPLVSKLTSDAEAAVQKQLRANEQFAGTPESTPNIKTNHKADDRAADVTVTVTVTSKGKAYDEQAAQSTAANWLKSDAASKLGDRYTLVGDTLIGTPQVGTTGANGTVFLDVSAEGIWIYQFSDAQKQQIAQLIAGKPLADGQALLQKQTGVKKVNVTTAGGWGTAFPSSPNDIKFVVLTVPGLQATPTS